MNDRHRLDVTVVGSGSSALAGPDGARFAYPAQLEQALRARLPGVDVKVTAHVPSRQTTADMAAAMPKFLAEDHPALVIWQAGTVDALRGVELDDFRNSLDQGLDAIAAAGADAIMVNMQYSPRTESMLSVAPFADVMRWVARNSEASCCSTASVSCTIGATKEPSTSMRQRRVMLWRERVHECIGRALAAQIVVDAAHVDAAKMQTTR